MGEGPVRGDSPPSSPHKPQKQVAWPSFQPGPLSEGRRGGNSHWPFVRFLTPSHKRLPLRNNSFW